MRVALIAVTALLLAGCGGHSQSGTVAAAAKADFAAQSATCDRTVDGKTRDVFRCELDGVDVAHRPVTSISNPKLVRCYADDDGVVSDVTAVMIRGCSGLRST